MLISSVVLFLLPMACLVEIDGPSEEGCTQCDNLGFRVRFSAHLTVLDTDEQNETISIMPEGARVVADCTSADPSIQKVLVLWSPPDDASTIKIESSSTTLKSMFARKTVMPLTTEQDEYSGTESTRSPERASTLTETATLKEISFASVIPTSDMTVPTMTADTATVTDNVDLSTESTTTGNDYTTPLTTTNYILQETEVMSESSTQSYGSTTATEDSSSTLVSEIYSLDTFSTETFADVPVSYSTTTLPPSLSTTQTDDEYLTTSTETSTHDPSSTRQLMETEETDLYSTETSTGTTTELEGTIMVTSFISENSGSATKLPTSTESFMKVLDNVNYRLKRSADMKKTTRNEIIFYFKEDNTTYFLNKVWMSFTVESLGIQYVQYMEGLHRWVTPIGYAYECAENVSFTLKDAVLTLENMKVAAFIPSACKFPAQSFLCGTPLPEADSTNANDPTINGILIAGVAMGAISLLGVAVILFRRCCKWPQAAKPRQLVL